MSGWMCNEGLVQDYCSPLPIPEGPLPWLSSFCSSGWSPCSALMSTLHTGKFEVLQYFVGMMCAIKVICAISVVYAKFSPFTDVGL